MRVAPSDDLAGAVQSVLAEHALRDADGVNWPLSAGSTTRAVGRPPLLQYCNGAPGVIVCLGGFLDEAFEREYLLPAGELIWRRSADQPRHSVTARLDRFVFCGCSNDEDTPLARPCALGEHGIRQRQIIATRSPATRQDPRCRPRPARGVEVRRSRRSIF